MSELTVVADPAQNEPRGHHNDLSRVPEVTAFFWIIKVLTTGMGETTSDFLVHQLGPPIAVVLGAAVFSAALVWQLRAGRYVAWTYWLAVAMVGVFGTMAADVLHVGLGIPYLVSTAFYAIVLTAVFFVWERSEHTLSIHSILTRRRELFYWAAVLATFALGTAAGDMTARTLGLGYLGSGIMFGVLIAVPAVGHFRFGWSPILAFWFAYIVTRPLGASFADWMSVPASRGGLGMGIRAGQLGARWADHRLRRLPGADARRCGPDIDSLEHLDRAAIEMLSGLHWPVVTPIMKALSSTYLIVFIAIGVVLSVAFRRLGPIVTTVITMVVAGQVDKYLKLLIDRPRPPIGDRSVHALIAVPPDPSMPSGHALTSFACAVVLAGFAPRLRWPLLAYASLVAISRPYLGVHYPSDVIVGAVIGAVLGLALDQTRRALINRSQNRWHHPLRP